MFNLSMLISVVICSLASLFCQASNKTQMQFQPNKEIEISVMAGSASSNFYSDSSVIGSGASLGYWWSNDIFSRIIYFEGDNAFAFGGFLGSPQTHYKSIAGEGFYQFSKLFFTGVSLGVSKWSIKTYRPNGTFLGFDENQTINKTGVFTGPLVGIQTPRSWRLRMRLSASALANFMDKTYFQNNFEVAIGMNF